MAEVVFDNGNLLYIDITLISTHCSVLLKLSVIVGEGVPVSIFVTVFPTLLEGDPETDRCFSTFSALSVCVSPGL